MSKKQSKPKNEQSVRMVRTLIDEISLHDRQMDRAIEKTMQWFARCPGPCFQPVYRLFMSHPAFLDAL